MNNFAIFQKSEQIIILEHKQFKDNAFTETDASLNKSVKNKLDQQMVLFILAANQDKYKKNLAKFYNFSFASSWVLSRNSLAMSHRLLNLIKTAAANSIATLLHVHRLWAQKNIQESAGSKTTQQKRSVNYEERFYLRFQHSLWSSKRCFSFGRSQQNSHW